VLALANSNSLADQAHTLTLRFADGQIVDSGSAGSAPEESIPAPEGEACCLTLAQAEATALTQHPALAAASADVRAARGRWVQVGLPPNPQAGYMGAEIGNEGSAGQQGGFVSQEFVTAGKLELSRSVAAREVAQAEQRWRQVELRVLTRVRTNFYQALVAQRAVDVSARMRQVADQGVRTAEQLLDAKEGTQVNVYQARIQAESAEILEIQARNRADAAWRSLAAAIGSPALCPQELCGELDVEVPQLDWCATLNRLLSESPELAELEIGVERARWMVARARAGWVPNVSLQTSVQYDDSSNDTVTGVQLTVPIPIFDRNQGNIVAAQAEVSSARGEVLNKQLELQQRLAKTFADFESSRQQVARYQDSILPSATRSLELVQNAYAQGELSYLDFLTAQRIYLQSNLELLTALAEYWNNWAAIEGFVINVPAQ
jgi:cobalt-zinc-cadmium efflux system outer membrane protein